MNLDDSNWFLEQVSISGGFLDGLDITLPAGLTCIIGPRGSGKSTLGEAIRLGIFGLEDAPKQRVELFKHNLAGAVTTLSAMLPDEGKRFQVRREGKQAAIVRSAEGTVLKGIELERGSFLPIDLFLASEVEDIATESLGPKRRGLLDQLRPEEFFDIEARITRNRRDLEANADEIRAIDRAQATVNEQIQGLAEARDILEKTPIPNDSEIVRQMSETNAQLLLNEEEDEALASLSDHLQLQSKKLEDLVDGLALPYGFPGGSLNSCFTDRLGGQIRLARKTLLEHAQSLQHGIQTLTSALDEASEALETAHNRQRALYQDLKAKHREAGDAVRARTEAEEAVKKLERLERESQKLSEQRQALLSARSALRLAHESAVAAKSALREELAGALAEETSDNVALSVRKGADSQDYQILLQKSFANSGLLRQEETARCIAERLRPDELAQLLHQRDYNGFESLCKLGSDRSRKAMDAISRSVDPFQLETLVLDDQISIELNVGLGGQPVYKDASQLSRGQKCTAVLPLLLARRCTPLIIDQPEDNLDNHFIFRTVVDGIRRLKSRRQMIFVTHNANIPVLGEADLIVILESDGQIGRVAKKGTLDDCHREICDLLEGGRKAFEMRRQRYHFE